MSELPETNPPTSHSADKVSNKRFDDSMSWIKWAAGFLIVIFGSIIYWGCIDRVKNLEKIHQSDHDKIIKLETQMDILNKTKN